MSSGSQRSKACGNTPVLSYSSARKTTLNTTSLISPSGEWAAYGFRDYREALPIDSDDLEPKIAVQQIAATLELSAVVHADRLPGIAPKIRLLVGLSAVIEDLERFAILLGAQAPLGQA